MKNTDKLHFEKTILTNGHILYTQKNALPVTLIRLVIPVGNAHAHKGNQNCDEGFFHFLEHMCFERSENHTDKSEYNNLLAKTGSSQNAWTDVFYTEYNFEAPAHTFHTSFPAFLDHLIKPAFMSEDIELEKGIVINERNQRKFFPGTDELSQYTLTKWMNGSYYPREQIFGSDLSLNTLTPELLKKIHLYYFSEPISIFVAGTFELSTLLKELGNLPKVTDTKPLTINVNLPAWCNKKWHQFASTDIDVPTIYLGGIFNNYNVTDVWGVYFILQLLTHEEFGTLQTWIRKDNGWSYGLEPDVDYERDRITWGIKIPVNSESIVHKIRTEIHERIRITLENSDFITTTKERLLLQTCFDYETISSRLDNAVSVLSIAGYIPTEADYKIWLEGVDGEYIKTLYKKYFTPEHIGEFLAVPKAE